MKSLLLFLCNCASSSMTKLSTSDTIYIVDIITKLARCQNFVDYNWYGIDVLFYNRLRHDDSYIEWNNKYFLCSFSHTKICRLIWPIFLYFFVLGYVFYFHEQLESSINRKSALNTNLWSVTNAVCTEKAK